MVVKIMFSLIWCLRGATSVDFVGVGGGGGGGGGGGAGGAGEGG